jgi:alginate O-acetyltransferase complex protein AlgI
MLFNSSVFFLFFTTVTLLYWTFPHRWRWLLLIISSCYFYMYLYPQYMAILGLLIFVDYWAGIFIENTEGVRRKWFLLGSLIANIGILFYFKYTNFLLTNLNTVGFQFTLTQIILPIGLSFHTFQSMSYTIEVYLKNQKAEKHFGKYALYVLFYPQLVAGPIERPQNILPQISRLVVFNYGQFTDGLKLMAWGFFKKVVIADRLSILVDAVFKNHLNAGFIELWIATVFFSFQIFCDFSGYTDMARGAAKTMGFDLMENFNKPYQSSSITEFWRRWHLSLSTWFRDYVYIPLGGNRRGIFRQSLNILVVFTFSGLWHGAAWTFVLWGFIHGMALVFENLKINFLKSAPTRFSRYIPSIKKLFVFLFVAFCWILFRAENVAQAGYMLKSLFIGTSNEVNALHISVPLKHVALGFLGIFGLEMVHYFQREKTVIGLINSQNTVVRWLVYYVLILLIIFFGVYENRQFIYFQF